MISINRKFFVLSVLAVFIVSLGSLYSISTSNADLIIRDRSEDKKDKTSIYKRSDSSDSDTSAVAKSKPQDTDMVNKDRQASTQTTTNTLASQDEIKKQTQEILERSDKDFMLKVSMNCPDQWETQNCLVAVSESTLALATRYGDSLQGGTRSKQYAEVIKNKCAAATAATQGEYPAYAMKSAYTECANTIYDVSQKTKVEPNLTKYQLLVASVLCMDGNTQCAQYEDRMRMVIEKTKPAQ